MRMFEESAGGRAPLEQMSFQQTKQAAAIMDCIGRLIPQEGIDYDVDVIFKGKNDPSVSMNIDAHTDKGEWWRQYVMKMIQKYPPTVENPEPSIPIDPHENDVKDEKGKENEEVLP